MRRSRRSVELRLYWLRLASVLALSAAALACLVLLVSPARAQDPQQKAAAEALFDEGIQLRKQGQYEQACRKFEQSEQIDTGVGVLLYLGECYERTGRLASAWALFREAHSRAKETGQTERAQVADESARRLSLMLSKLVLLVPQANRVPGFELLLNNHPISAALYGIPFPVDAGQHEITARAPGRQSWSSTLEVKGNADLRNVQVPTLEETHEPVATASATPQTPNGTGYFPATGPIPAPAPTVAPGPPGPDLTPVYLLGGVGVVAAGVGVVFGVRASDQDEQAKELCPSDCRSTRGADKNEAARTSALVANISYGVGAAALLTSAYLFITARSRGESAAREASGVQLGGGVQTGGGFVSVSGHF